ncbi:MAG TPA: hypothetical protein VN257_11920 [Actinotalea sp.]|nr:hypothetical protein [Actinotalea sp.]
MSEAPGVAVVLTQVARAEALAAACAIGKVPVDAVPTPIGAVAVCRDGAPGAPEEAARVISKLLAHSPVVLVVERAGQLTASRWSQGEHDEDLAAGLFLDGAPPQVEALLLGTSRAGDLPGTVSSVGLSRWRATRVLAAAARDGRRALRS